MEQDNKKLELSNKEFDQVNGGIEIESLQELEGLNCGQTGGTIYYNGLLYKQTYEMVSVNNKRYFVFRSSNDATILVPAN